MTTFAPGEYRTRGGGVAVVLEVFHGSLYGRACRDGVWQARCWLPDGSNAGWSNFDLIPPPPPVVVSDETLLIFRTHMNWPEMMAENCRRMYLAALAAAIRNHLAEQIGGSK